MTVAAAAAAAAATDGNLPDLPENVELTEVDGLRVITEVVPSVRSVALGLWVRTGSRDEKPRQAGLSHFLEHLLFKGTERHSAIQISELFDGMGAAANAATSKESTQLHARFLDEHTPGVFDLMAEMLLAPALPTDEIDPEREVVLEEIAMYEDEPQDRVHDVLAKAVYGEHPLGRRVLGEASVIAGVPRDDIAAYHGGRYTAENLVVSAAGHLEHGEILELARKHLRPASGSSNGLVQRGLGGRSPAALPGEGDRAVPHLLRRPRDRPRRRTPLRARRARRDLRRLDVLAPVPRDPREARPRLLGRLLHRAVRGRRHGRHVRRDPRGERLRGVRDHRPRAGPPARRGRQRRGADPGQGAREGPDGALDGVHRGPNDAPRPLTAVRPAGPLPRRDAASVSTT